MPLRLANVVALRMTSSSAQNDRWGCYH
jgi:hypothetical protein